jgi:hypothetical protein
MFELHTPWGYVIETNKKWINGTNINIEKNLNYDKYDYIGTKFCGENARSASTGALHTQMLSSGFPQKRIIVKYERNIKSTPAYDKRLLFEY